MTQNATGKKRWIIIGIAAAVAIIAVIIAVVMVTSEGDELQKQLDLGNQYLSEMEYHEALIAFFNANNMDPYCVEAYLGIADAYMGLQDEENALSFLNDGYALTSDQRLLDKMEEVREYFSSLAEAEEEATSTLPYFEENNLITTTETTWSAWALCYETDQDNNYISPDDAEMDWDLGNMQYALTNLTSYEDEYNPNYIHIAFDIPIMGTIHGVAATDGNFRYVYFLEGALLADYYTGELLPTKDSFGDETRIFGKTFTFNGESYSLRYSDEYHSTAEGEWDGEDFYLGITSTHTFDVRVPKDYDGLVLVCNLVGIMEYTGEIDYDEVDNHEEKLLDSLDEGLSPTSDYMYIRLSDLL